MTDRTSNVDHDEIAKFEKLAARWWDPESEFKPLHDINPLRLDYIDRLAGLQGKRVLDVGCGGGLLTEGMAARGADVTGIDMGNAPLTVARLHQHESGLGIDYRQATAEQLASEEPAGFDIVTCLEMLEHTPDPAAVIGAEYVLNLLPKGTHEYGKFIRPSEMEAWSRAAGLSLEDLTGMSYNPLTREYRLGSDVSVNYLACLRRA